MADLTITAANVIKGASAQAADGIAGATITAGMSIYPDASDSNKLKPCEHDQDAEEAACSGIALNNAGNNQPIKYCKEGPLAFGAILTVGETYVVGAGAGGIAPIGDLGADDYVTILGVASTTSQLDVKINATGVAKLA